MLRVLTFLVTRKKYPCWLLHSIFNTLFGSRPRSLPACRLTATVTVSVSETTPPLQVELHCMQGHLSPLKTLEQDPPCRWPLPSFSPPIPLAPPLSFPCTSFRGMNPLIPSPYLPRLCTYGSGSPREIFLKSRRLWVNFDSFLGKI